MENKITNALIESAKVLEHKFKVTDNVVKTYGEVSKLLYKSLKDEAEGNVPRGIYLCGKTGVGKTVLARAISRTLDYDFIQSFKLLNVYPQYKLDSINMFRKLIIDDVNDEMPYNDYGIKKSIMEDIIYYFDSQRYANKKPTLIITSNIPMNAMANILGDRAYSRLCQLCKEVVFGGNDFRILNK